MKPEGFEVKGAPVARPLLAASPSSAARPSCSAASLCVFALSPRTASAQMPTMSRAWPSSP
eukprot:7130848-Prymnesium_polylepis.1